jgi:hypothetical protein
MSFEQCDFEILTSSLSHGRYRMISIESCNSACIARYRMRFLDGTKQKWEMGLPQFFSSVLAPSSSIDSSVQPNTEQ